MPAPTPPRQRSVCAAYGDPRALITASDIDIVSVCVRVQYHRALVLAALAAHVNPAARRAAELIAAGAIGRPLTARIFSSTAGFAPRLPATHLSQHD